MNTPHVSRLARGCGLAVLLLLCLQCTAGAQEAGGEEASSLSGEASSSSREESSVSVLVSGPTPGRGLPFLPPNAIEYHRGLYELPGQNLLLYHTRREIVPPSSWEESSCGSTPLLSFRAEWKDLPAAVSGVVSDTELSSEKTTPQDSPVQPLAAFYRGEGYYLFFTFLGGTLSCDFIEKFIQKFIYFRSVSGATDEPGRAGNKPGQTGNEPGRAGNKPGSESLPSPPPPFPAVLD